MNATVTRVLINTNTKQAYGVEVLHDGKKQVIYASKEVIVSGGRSKRFFVLFKNEFVSS